MYSLGFSVDYLFYDFHSLETVGINISHILDGIGIANFVSLSKPIYVELVKEFYANSAHGFDEDENVFIRSKVGVKLVYIDDEHLNSWFNLCRDGFVCNGDLFTINMNVADGNELQNSFSVRAFLKYKVVIVVNNDMFEYNDFGIEKHFIHDAITRCLMPKHNTQPRFINIDMEIFFHLFKNEKVNSAGVMMRWMIDKSTFFHIKMYNRSNRGRKAGLPFGSILTEIFEQNGVDLTGHHPTPIKKGQIVSDSSLSKMGYSRTVTLGWIFHAYLGPDIPSSSRAR